MEVTLPNGTVIKGIPEGTHRLAVMEKAISGGLATAEDFGEAGERYSPVSETKLGRLGQGVKSGVFTTGRQLGNIVGIHDDDYMREMEALNADLMDTGMGMTGQIVGEIGATLPLGMGVGTVGKGLLLARRAGMLGKGATRALTHPATRGAVEGATVGAVLGGPDERAETAGIVGTLGAGFGSAGKLLGRVYGKFKLTSQTKEAKALQAETGTQIPLSQSAETGLVKQMYEGILANIPGVGGKIRGQYSHALDDLRRYIGTETHHPQGKIDILPEDTVHQMMVKLDNYWKHAYDDIGEEVIDLSKVKLTPAMRESIKDVSGGTFAIPRTMAKGKRVLQLKNGIQELMNDIPPGSPLMRGMRKPMESALLQIDRALKKSLPDDLWASYSSKSEYYNGYMSLTSAVKKAGDVAGKFTPKQLAGSIAGRTGKAGIRGEAPLQKTADRAVEALPDFPSKQGIFQTVAALGFTASFLAGVGTPVAIVPQES